jgi:hypothetical protein
MRDVSGVVALTPMQSGIEEFLGFVIAGDRAEEVIAVCASWHTDQVPIAAGVERDGECALADRSKNGE